MENTNTKSSVQKSRKGKGIKPLILAACALVVGLSVYADWSYAKKSAGEQGGYIYNSAVSGERSKILGEATYVGNITDAESGQSENAVSQSVRDSYFTSAAQERQRSRDESLDLLQTIVDSSESMPDAKNKALEDMTAIASAMEAETNIETLIRAKGFDDCICVIGSEDVNVVVKTTGLLTYEVAQIREIVMNELDVPLEKIKIIEKTK